MDAEVLYEVIKSCNLMNPHKFTRWSAPYEVITLRKAGVGDIREYPIVVQNRICLKCNVFEEHIIHEGKVPFKNGK